jgi:hypothetical protein
MGELPWVLYFLMLIFAIAIGCLTWVMAASTLNRWILSFLGEYPEEKERADRRLRYRKKVRMESSGIGSDGV